MSIVPFNEGILLPDDRPADVLDKVRELMAGAERGEVVGIGFVTLDPAGTVNCHWSYQGSANGFILVGAVARLLYKMNQGQD